MALHRPAQFYCRIISREENAALDVLVTAYFAVQAMRDEFPKNPCGGAIGTSGSDFMMNKPRPFTLQLFVNPPSHLTNGYAVQVDWLPVVFIEKHFIRAAEEALMAQSAIPSSLFF
jgi:hypothetical protein